MDVDGCAETEGDSDGALVGQMEILGLIDGEWLGAEDGWLLGTIEGTAEGDTLGPAEGLLLGSLEGETEGCSLGLTEG